jgi:hypothetical protein
MSILIF